MIPHQITSLIDSSKDTMLLLRSLIRRSEQYLELLIEEKKAQLQEAKKCSTS